MLTTRWWSNRIRPEPLDGNYQDIALAIDTVSVRVFLPSK
jgi:hypothetical protein